jgi:hypothetical protein
MKVAPDFDSPRFPEPQRFCTSCGHRPALHDSKTTDHKCMLPNCKCRYYYEGGNG